MNPQLARAPESLPERTGDPADGADLTTASFSPAHRHGRSLSGLLGLGTVLLAGALGLGAPDAPKQAEKQPAGPNLGDLIRLNASKPRETGTVKVAGLEKAVTIERDERGIPRIKAQSIEDATFAQGFVHAQERFFQMDLARRQTAGTLSELAGSVTLGSDKHFATYGFDKVADAALKNLPAEHKKLLERYAQGVNAGLKALGDVPPEYVMLKQKPAEWTERDTLLVALGLSASMNFQDRTERSLAVMQEALPKEWVEFLTPLVTRWDAPLAGDSRYVPAKVPGAEVWDPRKDEAPRKDAPLKVPSLAPGSNNFAIAGARTTHGGAILENDPHLQHSLPGVWFPCTLEWPGTRLSGVSYAGAPLLVIGSTDKIAWGFTNALLDVQDYVVVETDPDNKTRYKTADGWKEFTVREREIKVAGAKAETFTSRDTIWGPIVGEDAKGRPLALKWTALDGEHVNLGILDMYKAGNVEEAAKTLARWYGAPQNGMIADSKGEIGWVVTGYLPKRVGFSGRVPTSWASGERKWDGAQPESARPSVLRPKSGVLFTANQRTVALEPALSLGYMPDEPFRAHRLQELLSGKDKLDERKAHQVALDTRVEAFDYYAELMKKALEAAPASDAGKSALAALKTWDGKAEADSVSFRMVERFRAELHADLLRPVHARCAKVDPGFGMQWLIREEPVRRILEDRPAHLLPAGHRSWDAWIESRSVAAAGDTFRDGRRSETWGEANKLAVQHHFAEQAGALRAMLSLDSAPQSGHPLAVRVSAPSYGQSMRMVVSPGRQADGLFAMPGGVSGHPLAAHFKDLTREWLSGGARAFLPGRAARVLELEPAE